MTEQQVIVGAMLSQHPVDRTLLHPVLDACRQQLTGAGIAPMLRTVLADAGYASEKNFTRGEQQKLRLDNPQPVACRRLIHRTSHGPPGPVESPVH